MTTSCGRVRLLVCAVTFLATINHIFITNCFTLTLTQMVAPEGTGDASGPIGKRSLANVGDTCPQRNQTGIGKASNDGLLLGGGGPSDGQQFDWGPATKAVILSSLFAGFVHTKRYNQ